MLQERFTLVKNERDALEADSKNKLALLMQKLKELQVANKTSMEQLHAQSKQCDHLNSENKQLLEYVVCQQRRARACEKKKSLLCLPFRTVIARRTIFSPNNWFRSIPNRSVWHWSWRNSSRSMPS